MKIAFVGKGGSGKTTLTSLMARFLAAQDVPVLAIDADINQHLAESLGLPEEEARLIPSMGIEIERLKEYFRGTNARITSASEVIKTTPPGTGSHLLSVTDDTDIYRHFSRKTNGIRILAVGPFTQDDIGIKCYHSKTGAVELFLNHLIDRAGEYVLVDMTAGADSFASGLFTRFDVTLVAVEPTVKSMRVFEQYREHAKGFGLCIKAVGTKVRDADDRAFLKERLGSDLLTCITFSSFVRSQERGVSLRISELEEENAEALATIVRFINAQQKDWGRFYAHALEFHIKNAESWANASYGKDLTAQIDPTFSLVSAVHARST